MAGVIAASNRFTRSAFDGGTGNDSLDGALGDDVYPINVGDGIDRIRDGGGADTVRFGAGLSATDTSLERFGNDLVLRMAGTNDVVTIENYLKDPLARVETVLFTDGGSLPDSETIVEQLTAIRGTAEADSLAGTAYSDRLYGLEGDDTLSGSADDDTLRGGAGFDQYQFNAGDGNDTIFDPDSDGVVNFGVGIAPQSVVTTRTGDDLVLTVSGTADRVAVPGYFLSYPVAEFRFANGTVWTVDTIKANVTTPTSGPAIRPHHWRRPTEAVAR